jgi:hypothetical protein
MRRVLLVGLLAGIAASAYVMAGTEAAWACTCATFDDADAYARADAVFVGEVVDYEFDAEGRSAFSTADPAVWTFAVSEVFKGDVDETQQIVSEVSGASCGLEIPHSGEYVVFAQRDGYDFAVEDGAYYAGLCGGTRSTTEGPLAVEGVTSQPPDSTAPTTAPIDGGEDAPVLEAAATPTSDPDSASLLPAVLTIAGIVSAGLLLVLILIRARRRSYAGS